VVAIFRRFEAVTLFEGERVWKIRPPRDHDHVGLADADVPYLSICRVIDLEDGRSICYAIEWRTKALHWLVCRVREPAPSGESWPPGIAIEPPSEIPLLGTSLAALLDAALETGGDIGHLETGRLAQLLLPDEGGGDEGGGA
jgi:hypothetical protein